MKLGEAMYKAQQEAGAPGAEGAGGAKPDENVVDAEFTEVDDKKKGAA
jgi:molecular chaperone DnaK